MVVGNEVTAHPAPVTSRFFIQSTVALLGVGLIALLVIIGMTIWLGERAQVYFNEVIAARDARAAAVELRNAVLAAESSQRGYLVTGNEIYLAPYTTARTQAFRQLDIVKKIPTPYKEAAVAIERLTGTVGDKFDEMDQTIQLKRDRRDAEALAIFRTNRGKRLMDEANVFFSGVIRAADDRLTAGVQEQQTNALWLRWVSIIGGIVIVFVVASVAVTVLRYTRAIAAARDEVSALNTGLEARVASRTSELALANDEIQRFAHIVTHDLRAPLVNIMGFTSELESAVETMRALAAKSDPADPLTEQGHIAASVDMPEALGFIRSSIRKMDSLINAVLTLAREGRRPLKPERIDLPEIIRASAAAIQHQLSAAEGDVAINLDVPAIISDRLSLEQIFGNLLDNAVKYRARSRPLRIEVRGSAMPGNRIGIDVTDNGRGISDKDRERVFELFRRSGVQDQPGEGIGLAHVRSMVRNLGGNITVTSTVDTGTTFHLFLPRDLAAS